MRIEAAGERTEGGHDYLDLRRDEAATGHAPSFDVQPEFGMEMTGNLRTGFVADGFVAKNYSGQLYVLRDVTTAVIREAGVVIAHDPGPVEP
jgi:hypothetical protein